MRNLSFYLIGFFFIGLVVENASAQSVETNDVKPNVLLIIGESHRAEALGISNHPFVQTPNLDKLAKTGANFKQAHVTTAICVVSRASILSGQYASRHGINDFSAKYKEGAFEQTLPMLLKEKGYATAHVGTLDVGRGVYSDKFDYYLGGVPWIQDGVHNTDILVDRAADWLGDYGHQKPFFMILSFDAAHEVDPKGEVPAHYVVQNRYKGLYEKNSISISKTQKDNYWDSQPDFLKSEQFIPRKRWEGFFSDSLLLQSNSRDYYRLITGVDEAVGKIRQTLERLKLSDNTVVIYVSDHGFSLGEHGVMGKWNGFNVSTHVPFIVYDPRNQSNRELESSAFVLNIDIMPTILGLVNVDVPKTIQGVNVFDYLHNKKKERDLFYYEHLILSSPLLPNIEGVVTKKYRYMNYIEHNYETLFDFENDPDESINLALSPEYTNILLYMRGLYEKEKSKVK